MGCHTWFYKKTYIPVDKLKSDAIKICDYQVKLYQYYLDNPDEFYNEGWLENGFDLKGFFKSLEFFKRCRQFIIKDIFKTAGLLYMYNFTTSEYEEKEDYIKVSYYFCHLNNSIYVDDGTMPHDLFRIGKYPEDQLLSLEETLKFIEDKGTKIYNLDMPRLKEFWQYNPDGLIRFG